MAIKYTNISAQAVKVAEKGAQARITPGDVISAEVTHLNDYFDLADVEVGDVIYLGIPLPKGARPDLLNSRLTVFGDSTMVITGKLGYASADGRFVDDDAFGDACTSVLAPSTAARPDSFPPIGTVPKLPNQAFLTFTVVTLVKPVTTVTAIPATAVRGRAYLELQYFIFN